MTATNALDTAPTALPQARLKGAPIRTTLRGLGHWWSAALVALVAVAIRLPAVGFGLPYVWHPDEPTNVATAARMVDNGTLNPHSFIYPSTIYYVIAAFAELQKVFGGWHPLAGLVGPNTGIAHTSDPHLFIWLRLVTVALSVGTCLLVWVLCSVIVKRWWAATLAALLLAVAPLMVTNGVFITPDMYSAFFTAAGLLMAIAILRRGARRDYVLAGVAVGLAAGTKYNAVLVAVSVVLAHVLGHRGRVDTASASGAPRDPGSRMERMSLRPVLLAGTVAVVVFLATTPAALFDFGEFYHQSTFIAHGYATVHVPGTPASPMTYYVALYADQGVIFAVLGVIGILSLFGRWWRESLIMWAFVICYVGLIGIQKTAFSRDLLPAMPALAVLAALGLVTGSERLGTITWPTEWVWLIGVALALGGLAQPVAASLRVPNQLQERPRFEAQSWIYHHLPNHSIILEDSYGPFIQPLRYRTLETFLVLEVQPRDLPRRAAAIVLSELGSGRFLSDPKAYPKELSRYHSIMKRYCLTASFSNGPWIHILTPCRSSQRTLR